MNNTPEVLFQFNFEEGANQSEIPAYSDPSMIATMTGNCPVGNDDIIGNYISFPGPKSGQTEFENYFTLSKISPNNPASDLSEGYTICTWIKFNSFNGDVPILYMGGEPNSGGLTFGLRKKHPGTFVVAKIDEYGNFFYAFMKAENAIDLNKWYHISVSVQANGNTVFYVNGNPLSVKWGVYSDSLPTTQKIFLENFLPKANYTTKGILIGRNTSSYQSNQCLDADIAWLSVYKGQLSQTQVEEDMSIRQFAPVSSLFEFDFANEKSNIITGVTTNALQGTLSTSGWQMTQDILMGECLELTGTGSMSLGSVGTASDFQSGMTLTSWIKLSDITIAATILELAGGTATAMTDSFSFGINATGNLTYSCSNSGASTATITQKDTLSAKEWVHVAVSVDSSGNSVLYVDGIVAKQSEATQPTGLLPNSVARTVNTVGTGINGNLAWLTLYNGCLNISQVNQDLQNSADHRSSTFQNTVAVGFNLYSNYYGSEVPALYLVGSKHGTQMTLEVESNTSNAIVFPTLSSTTPSVENYHFQLKFKPGILAEDFIQKGIPDTSIWNAAVNTISSNGHVVISFICLEKTLTLVKGAPLTLNIPGVKGNPIGGARSTNVEFLYKLSESVSTDVNLDINGHGLQSLNVISHIGNRTSPLVLDVVGPARILNSSTPATPDSIKLRLFNSSTTDTISFYDDLEKKATSFQLNLPVEGNLGIPTEMAMIGADNVMDIHFGYGKYNELGLCASSNFVYGFLLVMVLKPVDSSNYIASGDSFNFQVDSKNLTGQILADMENPSQHEQKLIVSFSNNSYSEFQKTLAALAGLEAGHELEMYAGGPVSQFDVTVVSPSQIQGYYGLKMSNPISFEIEEGARILIGEDPEQANTLAVKLSKGDSYLLLRTENVFLYDSDSSYWKDGKVLFALPNKGTSLAPGQWNLEIAQTELKPLEGIEIKIDGIVTPTNSIAGLTYVNLVISNLSNYWQQNFNVPIEKSPLVLDNNSVALGSKPSSEALLLLNPDSNTVNALHIGDVSESNKNVGNSIFISPSIDGAGNAILVDGLFSLSNKGDFNFPMAKFSSDGTKLSADSISTSSLISNGNTTLLGENIPGNLLPFENIPAADGQTVNETYAVVMGSTGSSYSYVVDNNIKYSDNVFNLLLINTNPPFTSNYNYSDDVQINFTDANNYIRYTPSVGFTYNTNTITNEDGTTSNQVHQFNGNVKIGSTALTFLSDTDDHNVCLHIAKPSNNTSFNKGYAWSNYSVNNNGDAAGKQDPVGNSTTFGDGQTNLVSILADGTLVGAQFMSVSDTRIKHQIQNVDSSEDLQTLTQLEVKNYKHIDVSKHGSGSHKGLIAQEVETIFPQAVKHHKDFVPNIYEFANSVALNPLDKELTVVTNTEHALVVGDILKMVSDQGEVIAKVSKVLNDKTFVLENWDGETTRLFVIGKQVNDFRTVDYDQVAMLGVSAVQELGKKVERLEKENQELKKKLDEELAALKKELSTLK